MEVITAELRRLEETCYEDLIRFVYTQHTMGVPESIVANVFNYLKSMFLSSYVKNLITGHSNGEYVKMIRTGPKEAKIMFAEELYPGKEMKEPLTPGTYILYLNGPNEFHHACVVIDATHAHVFSAWGGTGMIYTISIELGRFWSNLRTLTTLPATETLQVLEETFLGTPDESFRPNIWYPEAPFFEGVGYEELRPSGS